MRKSLGLVVLLLAACASAPEPSKPPPPVVGPDRAALSRIYPGVTREKVFQTLGPPNSITKEPDGVEVMHYVTTIPGNKQRIRALLFSWERGSDTITLNTAITLRGGVVESLVTN